jgi:hypothetical protein
MTAIERPHEADTVAIVWTLSQNSKPRAERGFLYRATQHGVTRVPLGALGHLERPPKTAERFRARP